MLENDREISSKSEYIRRLRQKEAETPPRRYPTRTSDFVARLEYGTKLLDQEDDETED